ncbi:MAG: hypothetical protein ACNA75_08525 [Thiohalomonadaceae bacterium]
MSDNNLWYGYLEAGAKSSPVLMDRRLNTGDPKTLYLFNLNRGEILEYKREIIEPKLRELNQQEQSYTSELKSAFGKVRSGFIPRVGRASNIAEQGQLTETRAANDELDKDDDVLDSIIDSDEALGDEWEEEEA